MSKSILYANNAVSQSLAIGSVINFGQAVRRYGNNVYMSGGDAIVHGCGYYTIDANITFVSGGTTNMVITLYKDGIEIPGAKATLTPASAAVYQVSIPAVIRQRCDCESVITAVLTGVAGSVTNASIVVEKV